jgi:hypothetical protein
VGGERSPQNERRFLLSIKHREPDWSLLPIEGLDQWPAIQWKLHNIGLMSTRSHLSPGAHVVSFQEALNRHRASGQVSEARDHQGDPVR